MSGYIFFRNFWAGAFGERVNDARDGNRTQILVDGAVVHDRSLIDFFRNPWEVGGQVAPFDGPFTGNRAGAHLTHVPIPWRQQFQIRVFQNQQLNAARFHKVAGALAAALLTVITSTLGGWAIRMVLL